MRFEYNGKIAPPTSVSISVHQKFDVDRNGILRVEDRNAINYIADETPHVPLFDEDLGYRELQVVASRFEDVSGNLGEDELREALSEATDE